MIPVRGDTNRGVETRYIYFHSFINANEVLRLSLFYLRIVG